jgi:hypothetical protein
MSTFILKLVRVHRICYKVCPTQKIKNIYSAANLGFLYTFSREFTKKFTFFTKSFFLPVWTTNNDHLTSVANIKPCFRLGSYLLATGKTNKNNFFEKRTKIDFFN